MNIAKAVFLYFLDLLQLTVKILLSLLLDLSNGGFFLELQGLKMLLIQKHLHGRFQKHNLPQNKRNIELVPNLPYTVDVSLRLGPVYAALAEVQYPLYSHEHEVDHVEGTRLYALTLFVSEQLVRDADLVGCLGVEVEHEDESDYRPDQSSHVRKVGIHFTEAAGVGHCYCGFAEVDRGVGLVRGHQIGPIGEKIRQNSEILSL